MFSNKEVLTVDRLHPHLLFLCTYTQQNVKWKKVTQVEVKEMVLFRSNWNSVVEVGVKTNSRPILHLNAGVWTFLSSLSK